LNEEISRFIRIDDKAAKYLSILTLVAAVSGFFGKWIIVNLIPPKSGTELALDIVGATLFIMIFVSWFLIFNVLKIQGIKTLPLDDETIKFFDNNELVDIYYGLARGNKDAFEENGKITDLKSRKLHYGYISILCSVVLLAFFLLIFVIHSWNEPKKIKGEITMADDKKESTASQGDNKQSGDVKPNPDIKPPTYRVVTEGFDPYIIKDQKK
jgi:hypothetical protein